jgi:isoleucyl-tRNA synthetase
LATLHECLRILTLVLAPLTPFVAERVWQDLFASTSEELPASVHLASWPEVDAELIDEELSAQVAVVRRLVELGRSARAESRIPTRQPLGRALVASPGWAQLPASLREEIAEELNVASVEGLGDAGGELVDVSAKGNFRSLGKRFGQRTPVVAAAIAATDASALAAALRTSGSASVLVDGEPVDVSADEVVLSETPRSGWTVAADGADTVALDLTITPELRSAGLAREAVRLIQDARKSSGLDVSDRISLWWLADGEMTEAMRTHGGLVCDEVLATSLVEEPGSAGMQEFGDSDLNLRFWLQKT